MPISKNTNPIRLTGSELIVKMLEDYGITTIAGIPGGSILPLYDAFSQSQKIRHILTRHEQAAGFIAQGMARTSGKPAVCLASSGPGATNLLTAIADAKLDSVPIVCITGQVASPMIGTDAFQEVDTYGISIPVTKHNYLVRSVNELPEILKNAFRIAQSGRPGPVWIDIPKDIQTAIIELDVLPSIETEQLDTVLAIDDLLVKEAATMIQSAQKPILYLGGGIILSQSSEMALQLIERAELPTTTTLMGLGAIPTTHPFNLGMLGMHATKSTNFILQESDLLIVLGARFDDRAIGKTSQFCPNAKIIHVDIDRAELGKIRQPDLAINANVHQFLTQLLPYISSQTRPEWLSQIAQFKQLYPCQTHNQDPLTHYGLINSVSKLVDDNAFIATDVGQHQMWVAQAYPFNRPRQLLTSGGLGTMGFGLPAAIGAALENPEQTVVCFTGDGSIMMNIQEMATMVEHQLNIKIILLNNQALGLVRQQQMLFYDKHVFSSTYHYRANFIKIAEGFGLSAYDLNESQQPMNMLKQALQEKGPSLIHVRINTDEKVFPMVPPGAANIEMIGE